MFAKIRPWESVLLNGGTAGLKITMPVLQIREKILKLCFEGTVAVCTSRPVSKNNARLNLSIRSVSSCLSVWHRVVRFESLMQSHKHSFIRERFAWDPRLGSTRPSRISCRWLCASQRTTMSTHRSRIVYIVDYTYSHLIFFVASMCHWVDAIHYRCRAWTI